MGTEPQDGDQGMPAPEDAAPRREADGDLPTGGPSGGRPLITMGAEGLDLLLRKASVDRRFRRRLVATRADAARELGVELDGPTERSLRGASREWLLEQIAAVVLTARERSALLGENLLVMLEAMQGEPGGAPVDGLHGTLDSLPAYTGAAPHSGPAPPTAPDLQAVGAGAQQGGPAAANAKDDTTRAGSGPLGRPAGARRGFQPTYPKQRWGRDADDAGLGPPERPGPRTRRRHGGEQRTPRPSDLGHTTPVAVRALLGKASLQPEFAECLLRDRSGVADGLGMPLTAAETTLLDGLERAHLESMLQQTKVADAHRAALRGEDGPAMLAALGDPRPGLLAGVASAAPSPTADDLRAQDTPNSLQRHLPGRRRRWLLPVTLLVAAGLLAGLGWLGWTLLR